MTQDLAYQEKQREELINGTLAAMSPRPAFNHNRVAFRIAYLFERYLEGKPCTVIADGTDLYLSDKDRFIPDVMIVCSRDQIQWNGVHGAPDLVVEVLSPNGFGGGIDMMTGVDNDGNVTGIAVISHAETSGLGSKATDPEWQAQFAGKNGSVTVEKDGGEIVAITGSTITSRAICDGVNTAFTVVGSLG